MNNGAGPASIPTSVDARAAVGWAFFLASSWTWCIGMFLPALLVEDFGVVGWVAFAAPNVIGAFAVGGLRGSAQHRAPAPMFNRWAVAFSLATIAFHVAFLAWMTPLALAAIFTDEQSARAAGVVSAAILAVAAVFLARLRDGGMIAAAIAAYAISLLCLALAALTTGGEAFSLPPLTGGQSRWALLAVAPALALGFLLCPQLDLTLLRARRATAGRTRALAFALGFGGLFLAMIVASLLYADGWLRGWISLWIIGHFAVQSVFTMAVHVRELRPPAPTAVPRRWIAGAMSLGLAFGIAANIGGSGRLVYQGFLGLYGAAFPVFVWTLLTVRSEPAKAAISRVAILTIALAVPAFAVGQFTRLWWLLGVGVGLALATPVAWRALRRAPIA